MSDNKKQAKPSQALYKAKVACRVGGALRRAGEVFYLPRFETTPSFLEEIKEEVK